MRKLTVWAMFVFGLVLFNVHAPAWVRAAGLAMALAVGVADLVGPVCSAIRRRRREW